MPRYRFKPALIEPPLIDLVLGDTSITDVTAVVELSCLNFLLNEETYILSPSSKHRQLMSHIEVLFTQ